MKTILTGFLCALAGVVMVIIFGILPLRREAMKLTIERNKARAKYQAMDDKKYITKPDTTHYDNQ